ncbi:CapA family protein [Paenibacillus sp. strain BS8-2]
MSLSRSESRKSENESRKRRQRRSFSLLLVTLGIIIVAFGVWMMVSDGDWLSGAGGRPSTEVLDGGTNKKPGNDNQEGIAETDKPTHTETVSESTPEPTEVVEGTTDFESSGGGDTQQAGEGEAVTMSFVGDMLPGEYLTPLMKLNGYDYPYRNALLYLSEPDITAGNLELPVTTGGTPIVGTPYVYKGHPDALPAIKDTGFDVLSLANNHAMDQGLEGMLDTIRHLKETGIGYMGTGNNDKEAYEPYYIEAKGIKVAFVGLSRVIPYTELKADRNTPGIAETYDTGRAAVAIAAAKEKADLVVVMVHWGADPIDEPLDYQKADARAYIDAGADLVIGAHPHVLQGFEKYKDKWIAYSLGNFIFSVYPKGKDAETGVLDAACTKDGDCTLKFNPMIVVEGQPTPLEGEAAVALLDRLTSISYGAAIGQDGYIATR